MPIEEEGSDVLQVAAAVVAPGEDLENGVRLRRRTPEPLRQQPDQRFGARDQRLDAGHALSGVATSAGGVELVQQPLRLVEDLLPGLEEHGLLEVAVPDGAGEVTHGRIAE